MTQIENEKKKITDTKVEIKTTTNIDNAVCFQLGQGAPSKHFAKKYLKLLEQTALYESRKYFGEEIKIDIDSYILGTISGSDVQYDTNKFHERFIRKNSGKGQINAQEERVNDLKEKIKAVVDVDSKDTIDIDKGLFHKLVNESFVGREDYPRHPKTVKIYKEKIEKDLNKKINLTRKKK